MSKAFSLIGKNENILFLSNDKISRLYLDEYIKKDNIFNIDNVQKNIISVLILDRINDIENIELCKINFTNNISVYIKKNNILTTSFLTIKYFQDELGYIKSLAKEKYETYKLIYFKRNKCKILYLSDIQDNRINKIDKYLKDYCYKKKYLYSKFINPNLINSIERIKKVKKELSNTEYLLVIYKYSLIIDWSFNIEKFIRVNNLSNYVLSIDKKPTIMFQNFLVKNSNCTLNILDEILTAINQNTIENYIDFRNQSIFCNTLLELFNLEKKYNSEKNAFEFLINLNKLNNKSYEVDLDIILNYYINIYCEKPSIQFSNIYLKEYSWGILDKGVIGAIKFRFRNKLNYLNGEGTYERLTEHSYVLNFGEFNLQISFYDNFSKFIGYDINTKVEVIGFLHN